MLEEQKLLKNWKIVPLKMLEGQKIYELNNPRGRSEYFWKLLKKRKNAPLKMLEGQNIYIYII